MSDTTMINWLAKNFMDTRRPAGYVLSEMDRRMPNRGCFIGIATSSFVATMNRTNSDISKMTNTIMDVCTQLDKTVDAELSYTEGDTSTYCARIPVMPGRNMTFLFLQGATDKVLEDMDMVRKVFTEIERKCERVEGQTSQEDGGLSHPL